MTPVLFGQICLNGRSVRGGSLAEPPRLFFSGKGAEERGGGKEGREKGGEKVGKK